MLGQPVFIGGFPPPPSSPEVVASPVLSMSIDSGFCYAEYELLVAWSTTNPDDLNYKCRIVDHADPNTVYADDVGMSGVRNYFAGVYGGGASPYTFQVRVQVVRRSDDVVTSSQSSNSILRNNIGAPC